MQIEPDMIVRNIVNGCYYKVRSVTNTKAVCRPCTRTGKPPRSGRRTVAIEFNQASLRIVRLAEAN